MDRTASASSLWANISSSSSWSSRMRCTRASSLGLQHIHTHARDHMHPPRGHTCAAHDQLDLQDTPEGAYTFTYTHARGYNATLVHPQHHVARERRENEHAGKLRRVPLLLLGALQRQLDDLLVEKLVLLHHALRLQGVHRTVISPASHVRECACSCLYVWCMRGGGYQCICPSADGCPRASVCAHVCIGDTEVDRARAHLSTPTSTVTPILSLGSLL